MQPAVNRTPPVFPTIPRGLLKTAWREVQRGRRDGVQPAPRRPDLHRWSGDGLHAAWLGHSTVLFRIDGFTVLTDPVLGPRCGFKFGAVTLGPKRLVEPALEGPEAMPHVDLILLSHAHLDHFDKPTLRRFESLNTTIVTASSTADLLRPRRWRAVHELGWDESIRVGPLKIRAFRVRHWGARVQTDIYRGYNGYHVESPRRRVVFGGDTAYTDTFRALRTHRRVDLAIVPIGAYDPWIHVHCNPEQALAMANQSGAEFLLPVHHQTFRLSREGRTEPIERFANAIGGDSHRLTVASVGDQWSME